MTIEFFITLIFVGVFVVGSLYGFFYLCHSFLVWLIGVGDD